MTCTTARRAPGDPFAALGRLMREHVHEYGTGIDWGRLYESVRNEHIARYLECVPESAEAVVADAITSMIRGVNYERPRCRAELIKAVTTPGNGTCYAFFHVSLTRHLGQVLATRWSMAQEQVLAETGEPRDEPDTFDPKEERG